FFVSDKLYRRDFDIADVKEAYKQHLAGNCRGVLVMGEAGVGKSSLVSHVSNFISYQENGYLLSCKWDQNHEITPLSIIGSVFNELCEVFARDATSVQREAGSSELQNCLGNQATLLIEAVPSLSKIIPMSTQRRNAEVKSMRFLCCNLVNILSNQLARRVVIWLDDIQWSDSTSMQLIRSLIASTEVSKYIFFICSFRDDEMKDDDLWLTSISEQTLRRVNLANLTKEDVNKLISDTLQIFPRLSRPLASVIHHKTRGNPLFVVQLLESLRKDGYLYLNLSPCKWMWDLETISDLQISTSVLELLMKEMGKLSSELQLGLKVASCMGSYVKKSTLDIISSDVGSNLREVLLAISKKGFMDDVEDRFRFCHDRVQQASYDLIPPEERRAKHMRLGLTLLAHAINGSDSDELLFMALNQTNRGGSQLLSDFNQRQTMSSLNLRAGRHCIAVSDFASAQSFYESGISFLNADHWQHQYELSIELFQALIDVACTLNDKEVVSKMSGELLLHAKTYDDKLETLRLLVRHRRVLMDLQEAKRLAYEILQHLGEELPRVMTDPILEKDMRVMAYNVANASDETILGFEQAQSRTTIFLMGLYNELLIVFYLSEPVLIRSVILRMVQITHLEGICAMSSIAFANFGAALLASGDPIQAYRIGKLSLQLVDKMHSIECKASVNFIVHEFVGWVREPFQSTAESHLVGFTAGKQSGDVLNSISSYLFSILTDYLSGKNLAAIRKASGDFIKDLLRRKLQFLLNGACLFHYQSVAFIDGLEADPRVAVDGVMSPTWEDLMRLRGPHHDLAIIVCNIHQTMRVFLFRHTNEMEDIPDILNFALERRALPQPVLLVGIFHEGLVSFHMARQSNDIKWRSKGENSLERMTYWSQFCQWNFLNKALLLEAEKMYFMGDFERASKLYDEAIATSHSHKFIHEEAIASELAGHFYYERKGFQEEALGFFAHSVRCYEEWGAKAVASRV
ncbi:hypothetical protein THAPSDRAFT_263599, partial [Thalassiosira pseudonana CCMP1335]